MCRKANFTNDGFQVGLPVFTIHGNHDDPSGADNLSAVDVLSTCKLLNYFGKTVQQYPLHVVIMPCLLVVIDTSTVLRSH